MQGATDHLGQDLKANLLRLFAQLSPLPPTGAQAPGMFAGNTANLAQALPAFVRNALGNLGPVSYTHLNQSSQVRSLTGGL